MLASSRRTGARPAALHPYAPAPAPAPAPACTAGASQLAEMLAHLGGGELTSTQRQSARGAEGGRLRKADGRHGSSKRGVLHFA